MTRFDSLPNYLVGFDDIVTKFANLASKPQVKLGNYPPHNIRKLDENTYQIELAVAGFARQDITVELGNNVLTVSGAVTSLPEEGEILYRGIGMRNFMRTFAVQDKVEVANAKLINGMLKILLERVVPEENKPKKVNVE